MENKTQIFCGNCDHYRAINDDEIGHTADECHAPSNCTSSQNYAYGSGVAVLADHPNAKNLDRNCSDFKEAGTMRKIKNLDNTFEFSVALNPIKSFFRAWRSN